MLMPQLRSLGQDAGKGVFSVAGSCTSPCLAPSDCSPTLSEPAVTSEWSVLTLGYASRLPLSLWCMKSTACWASSHGLAELALLKNESYSTQRAFWAGRGGRRPRAFPFCEVSPAWMLTCCAMRACDLVPPVHAANERAETVLAIGSAAAPRRPQWLSSPCVPAHTTKMR